MSCPARDIELWKMRFPYLESYIVKGASHLTTPLYESCCDFIYSEMTKANVLIEQAKAV